MSDGVDVFSVCSKFTGLSFQCRFLKKLLSPSQIVLKHCKQIAGEKIKSTNVSKNVSTSKKRLETNYFVKPAKLLVVFVSSCRGGRADDAVAFEVKTKGNSVQTRRQTTAGGFTLTRGGFLLFSPSRSDSSGLGE